MNYSYSKHLNENGNLIRILNLKRSKDYYISFFFRAFSFIRVKKRDNRNRRKWPLIICRPILIKSMAPNRENPSISLNNQGSLTPSGKTVPSALSMMVDSMTSMVERAKIDIESVDQRARADLENIDQRARKDVALLDQRAREDLQKIDQKARQDIALLDKRAREDHELLRKTGKARKLTS